MFTKVKGWEPWRSFAFTRFKLDGQKLHALLLFQELFLSARRKRSKPRPTDCQQAPSNKIALSQSVKLGEKGWPLPVFSHFFRHVPGMPGAFHKLKHEDEILQISKSMIHGPRAICTNNSHDLCILHITSPSNTSFPGLHTE